MWPVRCGVNERKVQLNGAAGEMNSQHRPLDTDEDAGTAEQERHASKVATRTLISQMC